MSLAETILVAIAVLSLVGNTCWCVCGWRYDKITGDWRATVRRNLIACVINLSMTFALILALWLKQK